MQVVSLYQVGTQLLTLASKVAKCFSRRGGGRKSTAEITPL